ncbi:MAG: M48 family metallopeptidase [bacterium]|nr:M48 family metallopeptidase [bacterium]
MLRKAKWLVVIAVVFLSTSICLAQATPEESTQEKKDDVVAGTQEANTNVSAQEEKDDATVAKQEKSNSEAVDKAEQGATDDCKGKKDKDCVAKIGDRKMSSKLGNWYSLEKEIRIGKEYAAMVEQSVKLNQDPVINEYVNRIGQNIVRNSDCKVPFTIKVIDSDELNAFALPGGFFYVNTGLIMAADEESELAGVMAHETAHVCAHHATRQATRGQLVNLASIGLIFVGGPAGAAARQGLSVLLPMTFLAFSRAFEREADYLGVQYMYKAGYDPQAFITFFEKVQAKEKNKPGSLSKAFASHPQTPDRIANTQKEIDTILPPRDQYIVSTSEFDDIKARMAAVQNRRKGIDTKDNKPSLRRSNTNENCKAGDKKCEDQKEEDKPPVLKRRDDE